MIEQELVDGIEVRHIEKGGKYRVMLSHIRMKDSNLNWIDGVLYIPLYPNVEKYFCRSKESFLKNFEKAIE